MTHDVLRLSFFPFEGRLLASMEGICPPCSSGRVFCFLPGWGEGMADMEAVFSQYDGGFSGGEGCGFFPIFQEDPWVLAMYIAALRRRGQALEKVLGALCLGGHDGILARWPGKIRRDMWAWVQTHLCSFQSFFVYCSLEGDWDQASYLARCFYELYLRFSRSKTADDPQELDVLDPGKGVVFVLSGGKGGSETHAMAHVIRGVWDEVFPHMPSGKNIRFWVQCTEQKRDGLGSGADIFLACSQVMGAECSGAEAVLLPHALGRRICDGEGPCVLASGVWEGMAPLLAHAFGGMSGWVADVKARVLAHYAALRQAEALVDEPLGGGWKVGKEVPACLAPLGEALVDGGNTMAAAVACVEAGAQRRDWEEALGQWFSEDAREKAGTTRSCADEGLKAFFRRWEMAHGRSFKMVLIECGVDKDKALEQGDQAVLSEWAQGVGLTLVFPNICATPAEVVAFFASCVGDGVAVRTTRAASSVALEAVLGLKALFPGAAIVVFGEDFIEDKDWKRRGGQAIIAEGVCDVRSVVRAAVLSLEKAEG